jgi:hypothetical protein
MLARLVAAPARRSALSATRNSAVALRRAPTSIRALSTPAGGPTARAVARALSAQPRPYEGPYYFTPGGAFPLDDDRNPPRGPGGGHPASIALPVPARPSNEDAMLFPDPVAALDAAAALRADQDARRLHADDDVAKAA